MAQAVLVPQVQNVDVPKIYLSSDRFLIGRGVQNTNIIKDLSISRSHCLLIQKDDCWYLLDKSTNGTRINGVLIDKTKEYKLLHGDTIILTSNVKFIFQLEENVAGEKSDGVEDSTDSAITEGNPNVSPDLIVKNETNVSETSPNPENTLNRKETGLTYAEDELQCSICTEMFVKAVTLSCSHTFCKHCISEWRKNHDVCPICRTRITMEFSTLVLDNFISKIVENSDENVQQERKKIIEERNRISGDVAGPSGNLRKRPATDPIEISSDSSPDHDDSDGIEEVFDLPSFTGSHPYNGVPGYQYGGFGKCYYCGKRGHWANGCPLRLRWL